MRKELRERIHELLSLPPNGQSDFYALWVTKEECQTLLTALTVDGQQIFQAGRRLERKHHIHEQRQGRRS